MNTKKYIQLFRAMALLLAFLSLPSFAKEAKGLHKDPQAVKEAKELEQKKAHQRYKNLKLFADVLSIIERAYIEEIKGEKLIKWAIDGMIQQLDPHSYYVPPPPTEHSLGPLKKQPKPSDPLKSQLSGGTQEGRAGRFAKTSSVLKKDLGEGLFYVRILSFNKETFAQLQKIMSPFFSGSLLNKGIIKGLILDLRDNPGGLFNVAVQVADLFIKEGDIVHIKGRDPRHNQKIKAKEVGTLGDFPLLVLINGQSASSAEVLAGALKDNGRALLLGSKTFGKGSVQSLISLEQGGGVNLTVARYYTPLGTSIHKKGIKPHIELKVNPPEGFAFASEQDVEFKQARGFFKAGRYFNAQD